MICDQCRAQTVTLYLARDNGKLPLLPNRWVCTTCAPIVEAQDKANRIRVRKFGVTTKTTYVQGDLFAETFPF